MSRRFVAAGTCLLVLLPLMGGEIPPLASAAPNGAPSMRSDPDPFVGPPSPGALTRKPLREFAGARTSASPNLREGLDSWVNSAPLPSAGGVVDPVVQLTPAAGGDAPQQLTPWLTRFAGQITGANPPDPTGDVGLNDYVQMVNSAIQVWDKAGNVRLASTAINQIWINATQARTGFDECRTQNAGDPIVLYDQQADRFMVSQFTNPNSATGPGGTFPMCIAYSQTGDPTGNWFVYQFNLPRSHDYMKYGIWPDGLYMSTFEGGNVGAYVFDRAQMLSGSPATFQSFSIGGGTGVDNRRNRIVPSDWDGANPPPAGAPNYFAMGLDGAFDGPADRIEIREFHTDWANPANTTFTLATTLNTAAFDTDLGCTVWPTDGARRQCIPQPPVGGNPSQSLDALANRLMARLQYRNFGDHQSMVINQTVDADGANRAGVRWYELRNTGAGWVIHQQGTYAPNDGVHRWMGAAAMDGKGNIALGYSVSDGTATFPGLRFTARHSSDALGSMPQGEQVLIAGTAAEDTARWGDYAALAVDPVDDCTFWFTGERDNSQTTIGSFRLTSCADADLRITKSDAPDPVTAGGDLTYTIGVTNDGVATANGVSVTDVLPAGVALLNTTPACTNAAGTLTCGLGALLPGQTATLAIQVHIPSGFLGVATSAVISNTATVASANQADANPANNTSTATTTVVASADVAVTKTCKPDDPAAAGSTGFCDILVDNLGPSDAVNVVLTDVLTSATPFTVTAVTVTPSGTCAPTAAALTTSFTTSCLLGIEAAGGQSTIHVEITAADVAQVNDVATVSASTPDPNVSNNQATGTVAFVGSADLRIEKTGDATVIAGTQMNYNITVANLGPSTALNVSIADAMPLGVSFVSVSPSQGSCTFGQPVAGTLRCGLGSLASGAVATILVIGLVAPDVPPGTLLVNEAVASSETADPSNGNNRRSVSTTVTGSADLSVTKTDSSDPVIAGNLLTYTITARNGGPSTAFGVTVSDPLPAGTTFVTGLNITGGSVCALVQPMTVGCGLGDLDPSESSTVNITVRVAASVPSGTVLQNTVTVTSNTADPFSTNNAATADTAVATRADVWIDKQATQRSGNPSPVVTYTIVVHNDNGCETDAQSTQTPTCGSGGPSDAQNVVVVDTLPLTNRKLVVQYVSPQCVYTKATHSVRCTAATIPAGVSVTFVIEAQVQGTVGTILNTAQVSSTTADLTTANNTNAASIVIKGGTGKK